MQLFLLGVNHKTAPVEVREKLALPASRVPLALRGLRDQGAREAAILSTCNRAEIYAVGDDDAAPRIEQFWNEFHHLPARGLNPHIYRLNNRDSAQHLFRVASGVDSLVLGESQILGQVKTAFEQARESGAISGVLDELFRRAISCGKRARSETEIGRGALSVGSAAVELARQILGPLQGHSVLILGAGKVSALTAQHLVASGARRVIVANRTHERAQELARQFSDGNEISARAITWDEFPQHLIETDIVIASTRAPHFVLSAADVAVAMKARRHRPLFLVDIAVPRDIDPLAHQLDNVFLYDIDDLQGVVNSNLAQRGSELEHVETIIQSEVEAWQSWVHGLSSQPTMAALAQYSARIRDQETENALAQLPDLTEKEREIVRTLGRAVAAKIVHAPLRHLRESQSDAAAIHRAFDLDSLSDSQKDSPRAEEST